MIQCVVISLIQFSRTKYILDRIQSFNHETVEQIKFWIHDLRTGQS